MPKIRELGITVLPEGFGPMGVGAGGGCAWQTCSDCTVQPFSICGGTHGCAGGTLQCFQGTVQPCNQWSGCSDCTNQAFSICGGTKCGANTLQCAGGTLQCFQGTVQPCNQWSGCSDCTNEPFSICGGTNQCMGATFQCPAGSAQVRPEETLMSIRACGMAQPVDPVLTKAQIDQLKATLKQQLEALEQQEKALLPQTLEAIESREKEIAAELEQLKAHKAELKKTK